MEISLSFYEYKKKGKERERKERKIKSISFSNYKNNLSNNQTRKNIRCCSLKRQHTKWFTLLQNVPGECAPDTTHVRANISYICDCTVRTHRILTLERSFSGTYSAKHLFLSLREWSIMPDRQIFPCPFPTSYILILSPNILP